jgi:hypothetical protein
MRLPLTFLALTALTQAVPADEKDTRKTIDGGLKFLADEAVAWKADRKCASCHHIPMAIWTLNEGKQRGYAVDDKALAELSAWALAKDDPAKVNPKQQERKQVHVNQTPLMLALGFEAGDLTDPATRDGLKAMLALVLNDQDKDGAWRLMYVWEPHGSTSDVMTTLALLAISAANAPDLGAEGKAARKKGLDWLAAATLAHTAQSDGLRLVLSKRLGRPPAEWEPFLKRLLGRQNADGGWGQTAGAKSDAFATGQALYALADVGLKTDDPAVAKARAFLVKSQQADGSWEMASRPGGPGGKSAKNLAPITYLGTAWAVLGLIRWAPAVAKREDSALRPAN